MRFFRGSFYMTLRLEMLSFALGVFHFEENCNGTADEEQENCPNSVIFVVAGLRRIGRGRISIIGLYVVFLYVVGFSVVFLRLVFFRFVLIIRVVVKKSRHEICIVNRYDPQKVKKRGIEKNQALERISRRRSRGLLPPSVRMGFLLLQCK